MGRRSGVDRVIDPAQRAAEDVQVLQRHDLGGRAQEHPVPGAVVWHLDGHVHLHAVGGALGLGDVDVVPVAQRGRTRSPWTSSRAAGSSGSVPVWSLRMPSRVSVRIPSGPTAPLSMKTASALSVSPLASSGGRKETVEDGMQLSSDGSLPAGTASTRRSTCQTVQSDGAPTSRSDRLTAAAVVPGSGCDAEADDESPEPPGAVLPAAHGRAVEAGGVVTAGGVVVSGHAAGVRDQDGDQDGNGLKGRTTNGRAARAGLRSRRCRPCSMTVMTSAAGRRPG